MYLAGDIGGTKTNLALFKEVGKDPIHLERFPSQEYANLETIVSTFWHQCQEKIPSLKLEAACFAIAGPVHKGVSKATNLPWVVETSVLAQTLQISDVYLINDLEANAYALHILPPESLLLLYEGDKETEGNQAVVSPGTGLGEAGLYWDGKRHHPFAGEGGHCEFGPRDEIQIDLCRYLYRRFGHASYERILSGPGLVNVFDFLAQKETPSPALKGEMQEQDPAAVITQHALNGTSQICTHALDLFVSILGSEAGNCVLKFMATGGLFLGGGIPPKILPKLKEKPFLDGFLDKGRFRSLLELTPIRVILDDKASLKGASYYCSRP